MLKTKENKGITIIAIVVTIVVLLILAGISVSMITGENGIIGNASGAKEQAEISEEKEEVEFATAQAMEKNKYGDITVDEVQSTLDNNLGDGEAEAIDNNDTVVVKFIESERYYEIDNDGNVDGPKELIQDDYPGDITKGGTLDGSEEKPYEIRCIEDLVAFSKNTNDGNTYAGKFIILVRNLDFASIFSYNNYETTEYNDYLGVDNDINLIEALTDREYNGFISIGTFSGNFNGQNYKISNLYENDGYSLFMTMSIADEEKYGKTTIKNISVNGKITSSKNGVAGIVYYVAGADINGEAVIDNCHNFCDITSTYEDGNSTGGIVGDIGIKTSGAYLTIKNCSNYGKISSKNTSTAGYCRDRWYCRKYVSCRFG